MKKYLYLLLITIFLLSIGYSLTIKNIFIKDISANVRITKDIRITNLTISESTVNTISLEEYNISNITANITLPNSDSYIRYQIEITNLGNSEMGIIDITGLPSNLTYTLEDYTLKDKICNPSNECTLGIKKTFYLTIKYNEYNSFNTTYNIKLDFLFKEIYPVTITGLPSNITYKNYILNNDTYTINNIPNDYTFEVTMNNIPISNYLFNNNTLTINNVNGPISIKAITKTDFLIDDNTIELSSTRISLSNPVTIQELLNMSFNGTNNSNKMITKMDIILEYSSNTGSNQKINCLLEYNGISKEETINLQGNTTSSVTITFDNLNININDTFTIKNIDNKITNGNINITKKTIHIYF